MGRGGRRAALVALAIAITAPLGCRLRPAGQEPPADAASPATTMAQAPAAQGQAAPPAAARDREARALQIGYPALPVEDLVARARGGVVNLRTTVPVKRGPGAIYPGPQAQDDVALGSGVLIDREGRILTNDHLVAQARELRVRWMDGTELPARVLGRAPELDVALLAVDSDRLLEPVPLGASSSLRVGEWVVALGNPFGHEIMAHVGIVASVDGAASALALDDPGKLHRSFVVVDAAIHAANSGGPLVDMTGSVVGINVATEPSGSGVGFAVPIDRVTAVLQMLERDGRIQQAWLGVYIQPVTPELAARRGLEGKGGALVAEVRPNTPGARAGLAADDIILRFDGQAVDHRNLPWLVATAGAGRRIPLLIRRDGAERTLEFISELRPE
jgi:serine protease Do